MAQDEILGRLRPTAGEAYGDPIVLEDGRTIVPVSRVRWWSTVPLGVFVLDEGEATWTPVVDANRVAQVGVATGFVAATLGCLAVLRRPPWPTTTISVTKTR